MIALLFVSILLSMREIVKFFCLSVKDRRYRAVDNPAIPPPRMMTCSVFFADVFEYLREVDEISLSKWSGGALLNNAG